MVKALSRRLPLLALAALIGAVGIGPRRGTGSGDSDDSSPPAAAPGRAAAPRPRAGIAPRASAPASGFSSSSPGPVGIRRREGVERTPRRHYWHDWGGRRYSHYFDGRVHWYGYPYAASFVWMRPYGGLWWTWDARFSRWVYWNDGFWWWPGPGGAHFVYVNDDYYPYDAVSRAASAAPPAAPPGERGAWTSPDGRRLVEVAGPGAQAILYDKTGEPPLYLRFLGNDAQKVRFSSATAGSPPAIAVEFRGGSVAVFDYDGRRLDAARPAGAAAPPPAGEVPPAAPEELPPPPENPPAPLRQER